MLTKMHPQYFTLGPNTEAITILDMKFNFAVICASVDFVGSCRSTGQLFNRIKKCIATISRLGNMEDVDRNAIAMAVGSRRQQEAITPSHIQVMREFKKDWA